jgi:thioester reductase-like protein
MTSTLDWQTEPPLDPSVRFDRPPSPHAREPRRVFLTGATGFLGAFLLHDLLLATRADVYCLVRDAGALPGAERLRAHLTRLGLWRAGFEGRIVPVVGDLGLPLLGLSRPEFDDLADRIDVIYHCGVLVDFLRPYAALRATNVLGTQEILRLAGTGPTKAVHHTSTLAVFFGRAHLDAGRVSELDAPVLDAGVQNRYTQSKWAAERLVLSARERGLPAAIYRTGRISGHSRTGATSNEKDLLNKLLKACILLKASPAWTIDITMIPVDYVSRAMVHLAGQPRSLGRAFHLVHPRPVPWRDLIQMVVARGYPVTTLAEDAWRAALKRAAASDHPERDSFARLWLLLSAPNSLLAGRPRYETPHSDEGLRGASIVCPPIDEALVATYLAFFQESGYIPLPEGAALADLTTAR